MPEPRTRCPEGGDSGCNRGCNEIAAEEERDFVPKSRNEVIGRLVAMAVDEEPLSEEVLQDLERSLEDLRAGRVCTLDQVMTELKEE